MPYLVGPDGRPARVSPRSSSNQDVGRLDVSARADDRIYYISRDEGQAYRWTSDTYNYSAADTILLVKNTSTTKALVIHGLTAGGDTATEVVVHLPTTEVTPTGTANTGRNINGNSAHIAAATAIRDETNNSQGDIIDSFYIAASTSKERDYHDSIRLAQNQSIGIDFVTVGTGGTVSLEGYFE